uniref:Protein PRRC1 n=1 Tax=Parasteatoda tepidariorum TaxID=114398 RepID=A0A2L2Y9F8_PARTP
MMEELGDDTNGDSTFEFLGGKNDENLLKEAQVPEVNKEITVATPLTPVSVPSPPPSTPYQSSASAPDQSKIHFYNPTSSPEYFSTIPTNSLAQSSVPLAGPFVETQNWNQYAAAAIPQPPISVLNPNLSQCSIVLPGAEQVPNTFVPESPGEASAGMWGWIKGNQLLNRVAEKAKSSVDSVITTLDPGMKEIINSGGDINVIVASGNEAKISAVREAFQQVFGKATVQGIAVQSSSIAPQPVGFSAGLKAAEERINNIRQQGYSDGNNVLLAIENFIVEFTPENWFDMGCLLLQDSNSGISLQVYTEAIPISSLYVNQAKDQTPADYPLGWSGHAITVGQIIGSALGVHHSEWHEALTGVSRREILLLAAKSIAGLYRKQLRR